MTDRKGIGDIISTVTTAVLFLVILLLVVFSAASYKHATDVQNENNNRRALLSYIVSSIELNSRCEIESWEKDGAEGISIKEPGSGYERRIYMLKGELMEEYTETDRGIDPEEALVIGKTDIFEVNKVRDDLVEIRTDIGASYASTGE